MTKQKLILIIGAAILAFAISVGLVVSFGSNGNQGNNGGSTLTPAQQYVKLEGDALHSMVNGISETQTASGSVSTSTIDIIPSDALFAIFFGNMDMSWAEKITLKMDSQVDGMLLGSLINISINDRPLLVADLIANTSKNITYLCLPSIGNGYLKIDQNSITGDPAVGSAASVNDILSQLNMPETKAVKALLNKYIDLGLANMTLVEKTTQDMTVGGKTQTVTVYTNYITEKVFNDTLRAILSEVKQDAVIKSILPEGADIGSVIDQLLASLNTEPSEDKEEAIVLRTYVNFSNEIIGRALSVDREINISSLTLSDKNGSVSEISVAINDVKYTLTGSYTSGRGSYTLSMTSGGQTLVIGTLTYAVSGQSGSCELKLSDFIEQNFFGSTEIDPSLKINWNITNSGNAADIDLYLYMMSQQIIGIETTFTALEGEPEVTIPDASLDINNEDHMNDYLSTLDFTALEQNMRAAGIPGALVDALMAQLPGNGK